MRNIKASLTKLINKPSKKGIEGKLSNSREKEELLEDNA